MNLLPSPDITLKRFITLKEEKFNYIPSNINLQSLEENIDNIDNIDKLTDNIKFRDFIWNNLNNEYIFTILLQNVDKNDLYTTFNLNNYTNDMNHFNSIEIIDKIIKLGKVDIPMNEIHENNANKINNLSYYDLDPFFKSFQLKLAMFRSINTITLYERNMSNYTRKPIELKYNLEFKGSSNSLSNPLNMFFNVFINTLSLLPNLMNTVMTLNQYDLIHNTLKNISKSFSSLKGLSYFKLWSSRPMPYLIPISMSLENVTVTSSTMQSASYYVNGSLARLFKVSKPKGDLLMEFDKETEIIAIRISWASLEQINITSSTTSTSSSSRSFPICPPRKLVIRVNIIYPNTNKSSVKIYTFYPLNEYQRVESWIQVYYINEFHVKSIQLQLYNYLNDEQDSLKLYNLEVLQLNKSTTSIDIPELCLETERSLFPLIRLDLDNIKGIRDQVFHITFDLIKISGSLNVILHLIQYLISHDINQYDISSLLYEKLYELFLGMTHSFENDIKQSFQVIYEPKFDTSFKSIDIQLENFDNIASSSLFDKNSYIFIPSKMEVGVWTWEIAILGDASLENGCYLGLGRRFSSNLDFKTCSDVWLLETATGRTFHNGKTIRQEKMAIYPNDVCKFTFNCSDKSLILEINNNSCHKLFDNIPSGVYPLACFYENKRKLQILSIQCNTFDEDCINMTSSYVSKIASLENITTSIVQSSLHHYFLLFLSNLCQNRINMIKTPEMKKKLIQVDLEYPYFVEVTIDVFMILLQMLEYLTPKLTKDANELQVQDIVSVLKILNLNLLVLKMSNIDLQHVGFPYIYSTDHDQQITFIPCKGLDFIERCKVLLSHLMDCPFDLIRIHALSSFADGSILFLPNISEKLIFLEKILAKIQFEFIKTIQSESLFKFSEHLLFRTLMIDLSNGSNILALISILQRHVSLFKLWTDTFVMRLFHLLSDLDLYLLEAHGQGYVKSIHDSIMETRKAIVHFLKVFQQQGIYELISISNKERLLLSNAAIEVLMNDKFLINPLIQMLELHFHYLVFCCLELLKVLKSKKQSNESFELSQIDKALQSSVICQLLQPLLYQVCFCFHNLEFCQRILPSLRLFLEAINDLLLIPTIESKLLYSLWIHPTRSYSSELKGWKSMSASYENLPSIISDGGKLFTSTVSNNTCVVVDVVFDCSSKGAWEFQLEQDSVNDECSVFGAARINASNRCYRSSPDLWMRRAYNGELFCCGEVLPTRASKIRPGDIIRIEFDGLVGTLAFSINSSPLEILFTNIRDPVSPACGSYRNGIKIRLLKVEKYCISESENMASKLIYPNSFNWNKHCIDSKDSTLFTDKKVNVADKSVLDVIQQLISFPSKSKWITNRTTIGVFQGRHEWGFEVSNNDDMNIAIGITYGSQSTSFERNDFIGSRDVCNNLVEVSWHISSGSLWVNGMEHSIHYGDKYLPLATNCFISMILDCEEGTLSYSVNGHLIGIAFGPASSHPAVVFDFNFPIQRDSGLQDSESFVNDAKYPTVSVMSKEFSIRIVSMGLFGSLHVPNVLALKYCAVNTYGRLCAILLSGEPLTKFESKMQPWLQSPLFKGGFQSINPSSHSSIELYWQKQLEVMNMFYKQFTGDKEVVINESLDIKDDTIMEKDSISNAIEINLFLDYVANPNLTSDATIVSKVNRLLERFESIQEENVGLKKFYERKGLLTFPIIERPFIACLLKHSGLIRESVEVLHEIDKYESLSLDGQFSDEMTSLGHHIKQLRQYLRRRHREIFNTSSDGLQVNEDELSKNSQAINEKLSANSSSDSSRFDISNPSIQWENRQYICEYMSNHEHDCRIYRIGYDSFEHLLYVEFAVSLERQDMEKINPTRSVFSCGEFSTSVIASRYSSSDEIFFEDDKAIRTVSLAGYLQFRIDTHIFVDNSVTRFQFSGNDQYESVHLILADIKSDLDQNRKKVSTNNMFDDLCQDIKQRAMLLLTFDSRVISENIDPFNTSDIILGFNIYEDDKEMEDTTREIEMEYQLSKASVTSTENLSAAKRRWGLILRYLRDQAKNRIKSYSGRNTSSRTSFSSITSHAPPHGNLETSLLRKNLLLSGVNYAQAAMHSCVVFLLDENENKSAHNVRRLINTREIRANQRKFSLDALYSLWRTSVVQNDPYSSIHILILMKSAFYSTDMSNSKMITKGKHYLSDLEGCRSHLLSNMQVSFIKLFTLIAKTTRIQFKKWRVLCFSSSLKSCSFPKQVFHQQLVILLSIWHLQFSSRDLKFLHKCGILQLLFKVCRLEMMESFAKEWSTSALELLDDPNNMTMLDVTNKSLPDLSQILKHLKCGKLSIRQLVYMIYEMQPKLLYEQDMNTFNSLSDVLKHFEITRYLKENHVKDSNSKEQEIKIQQKQMKDLEFQAMKLRVQDSGALADSSHSSYSFSEFNLLLTVRNTDSLCVTAAHATISYHMREKSEMNEAIGNYFEVEILEAGPKDIGIGLADLKYFSLEKSMPGWVDHSYGYHGDDGKKFGDHCTPGIWPLFNNGDIIGCGVTKDSIFYTRNGKLLGIAFAMVPDERLTPVFGFTDRHSAVQSIRVNFGVRPFCYKDAGIIVNPKALALREEWLNTLEANFESSILQVDESQTLHSERVFHLNEVDMLKLRTRHRDNSSAMNDLYSLRILSLSLLKHFAHLSDETKSLDDETSTEESVESDSILNKELSTFGTLKMYTSIDGKDLNEEIVVMMMQEIMIGGCYVRSISKDKVSNMSSSQVKDTFDFFSGSFSLSGISKSSVNIKTLHEDESLGHSNASQGVLDQIEVEANVQEYLYLLGHLVQKSVLLKRLISSKSSLRSLFIFLDVGSPNIKRQICQILTTCISVLSPDEVEMATLKKWKIYSRDEILSLRRLPNTFLFYLLREIKDTICFMQSSDSLNEFNCCNSFGFGELKLSIVNSYTLLFQEFAKSTLWTEVVTCCITDIFRSTLDVFPMCTSCSMNDFTTNSYKELISLATAAASTLCGTYSLHVGCRIKLSNHQHGIVVDIDNMKRICKVVLENSLHLNALEFQLDEIEFDFKTFEVDFEELLQPLGTHIIELFALITQWSIDNVNTYISHSLEDTRHILLTRLSFYLSHAMSLLVSHGNNYFIDSMLDTQVFMKMLQVSQLTIPLNSFYTFQQLLLYCNFMQGRVLERGIANGTDMPISDVIPNEVSSFSEIFSPYDPITSKSINLQAKLLSEELNINENICSEYLKYFHHDVISASSSLKTITSKQQTPLFPNESIESDDTTEHLFSYDALPLSSRDHKSDQMSQFKSFERIEMSLCYQRDKGELCSIHETNIFENILVSSCDESLNCSVFQLMETKDLMTLKSWNGMGLVFKSNDLKNIYMSLIIMSIRRIVQHLIVDENVNLLMYSNDMSKIVKLLKLMIATSKISYHGLDNSHQLFDALLLKSNNHVSMEGGFIPNEDDTLVDYLISDVSTNLYNLSKSKINFSRNELATREFSFSSLRPNINSIGTSGALQVPQGWNGIRINFHEDSYFLSSRCRLKFYDSLESYKKDDALIIFKGPCRFEKSIEKEGIKDLFYKYDVISGADRPSLKFLFHDESIKTHSIGSNMVLSIINNNSFAAALGDDDSLFTLFETKTHQTNSTQFVICDMPGISEGSWYFEVKLRFYDIIDSEVLGNLRIGYVDSSIINNNSWEFQSPLGVFDLNEVFTVGFSGDGFIYGKDHFISQDIKTSPGLVEDGDVFGCLITMSMSTSEEPKFLSMNLCKNGKWLFSIPFSCEIPNSLRVSAAVNFSSQFTIVTNFGEEDFFFPPSLNKQILTSELKALHDRPIEVDMNYGFEFKVSNLSNLNFKVTRKFELVYDFVVENKTKVNVEDQFWIWRPMSLHDEKEGSLGDMLTKTRNPPIGAIMLSRDNCKKPIKFALVVHNPLLNLSIWRPIAPSGYIALGDIAKTHKSADDFDPPSIDSCLCVPMLSMIASDNLGSPLFSSKILPSTSSPKFSFSLWSINNNLGTFFASQDAETFSSTDDLKIQTYDFLNYRIDGQLEGEWFNDEEVVRNSSLCWIHDVISYLISKEALSWKLLQLVPSLCEFIYSPWSPNVFSVIPMLSKIIRLATSSGELLQKHKLCEIKERVAKYLAAELQKHHMFPIKNNCISILLNFLAEIHWNHFTLVPRVNVISLCLEDNSINDLVNLEGVKDLRSPLITSEEQDVMNRLGFVSIFLKNLKNTTNHICPIISKLWYSHFSNCLSLESNHPLTSSSISFSKDVYWPGTERFRVTFDKRSSLPSYYCFKIMSKSGVHFICNSASEFQSLESIIFPGDKLTLTCEVSKSNMIETSSISDEIHKFWGWGLVINAFGKLFETSSEVIELKDEVRNLHNECIIEPDAVLTPRPAAKRGFCQTTSPTIVLDKFFDYEIPNDKVVVASGKLEIYEASSMKVRISGTFDSFDSNPSQLVYVVLLRYCSSGDIESEYFSDVKDLMDGEYRYRTFQLNVNQSIEASNFTSDIDYCVIQENSKSTSPQASTYIVHEQLSVMNIKSSSTSTSHLQELAITPKSSNYLKLDVFRSFNEHGSFKARFRGLLKLNHQLGVNSHVLTPLSLQNLNYHWNEAIDDLLLDYLNVDISDSTSKAYFNKPETLQLPLYETSYLLTELYQCNQLDIQARILMIKQWNDCIEGILPLINFSDSDNMSFGNNLRRKSHYILMYLKLPILETYIHQTTIKNGLAVSLVLDNTKAMLSIEKKTFDISQSQSCFCQAFKQLHKKSVDVYKFVYSTDRIFQITFTNEDGIDAGGPFREGMSRIVDDLFSDNLNLFLLNSNGVNGIGFNQEKYVPNVSKTSYEAKEMFRFVGRLIGACIRVKLYLPFDMSPIVWKKIIGENMDDNDLKAIDIVTATFLMELKTCQDEDSFNEKYNEFDFSTMYANDNLVEPVIFMNRLEFCDQIKKKKLNEFDLAIAEISHGINEVIDLNLLRLFSWKQLETLVCGNPIFDIKLWKKKTDSSGISSRCADLFWNVIESLTQKEQAGFIRFAWGRSRLPIEKDFTTKMILTQGRGALPVSHTCFFSIELPDYQTENEMRHGILTAIHFGAGGILNS